MGRHRKPDEFGDPNDLTEQHPIIDVMEVDIPDLSDPCEPIPWPPDPETAPTPPRHERFEPMYQGGLDPHETAPITMVTAGAGEEQLPWPLVPRDEPLAAQRDPLRIAQDAADQIAPELLPKHGGHFVWAVTATIAACGSLGALLYALIVLHAGQPARCPTPHTLIPTVTVTAPPPADGG